MSRGLGRRHRGRGTEFTLLRPVPGNTVVHRLWAGTKMLALGALAVVLSLRPVWWTIALGGGLVVAGLVLARIPRGAVPRLPRIFWVAFVLTAVLTLRSTARPIGHVAGVPLSWGGLETWVLLTALATVILAAAALISWTTPLAEVAPALSRLGAPLKRLHLPVDEWATTVALSIRCLPLLIDEVRSMAAARRMRPSRRRPKESRLARLALEGHDLLVASLAVSLRRAADLGEAIEARGGFGPVSGGATRPGRADAMVLVLMAGLCLAAVVV